MSSCHPTADQAPASEGSSAAQDAATRCCAPQPAPRAESSCCAPRPAPRTVPGCCAGEEAGAPARRTDWLLTTSALLIVLGYGLHLAFSASGITVPVLDRYAMGIHHVVNAIWWGVLLGM
ncbi:MAG: hypothetical protein RLW62_21475, partial [Gammaproteobacteria bacterium]